MGWFKVDDQMATHVKALSAGNKALGLWVRAGAWSCANLTDGLVPELAIGMLGGDEDDVTSLVDAGLWRRVGGGVEFHDWSEYQPTAESERERRDAARERMRAIRAKRSQGVRANTSRTGGARSRDVTAKFANPDPDPDPDPENPSKTYPSTSSSLPRGKTDDAEGFNPNAVINAVREHAGIDITVLQAGKIAALVMDRRRIDPHNPTAYITASIKRDPAGIMRALA